MALGIEQILQPAIGMIFGQYFGLLFGSQESQAEREERIRRTFTEFLQLVSRDFQSKVEQAIRAAFLDQSFEEIKTDCITAINLFRQHAYTITQERPAGEEASLNNASLCIERASSRLQVVCERMCNEPLPAITWALPGKDTERAAIIATMRNRLAVVVTSVQTVASIHLLILAKRAERNPGLRNAIVREIIPNLLTNLERLDARQRAIQPLRIAKYTLNERITRTDLANHPLTFGNIETRGRQIYPRSPDTDEIFGIIEFTYDLDTKVKAFVRYHAGDRRSVWALRHYGLIPARWTGAIFFPANDSPDAPLPSQQEPANSLMAQFQLENITSMGLPMASLAEVIRELATRKLISLYEAQEYNNIRTIRNLAENFSAVMARPPQ